MRSSSKTEMVPLLSPTMESEMLQESWTASKLKSANITYDEKNSQNLQIWEENYQDLSGWCMDQFPEQYDFPIGEAINCKMTDMSYENDVSTIEVPEGFTIVYDEKINNDENILQMADLSSLQSAVKLEKLEPSCTLVNQPDVWFNVTTAKAIETTTNYSNAASIAPPRPKLSNLKVQLPLHQETEVKIMDPLEPAVLSTLAAYEPESFDLLSYLCDDDIAIPSASTKTSVVEEKPKIEESTPRSVQPEERKLRRRTEAINQIVELRESNRSSLSSFSPSSSSSSSSSSYLEKSSRAAKRIKKPRISTKAVKDFYKEKRRGPKRKLKSPLVEEEEEDEEDNFSDNSGYRESRVKNNEASRKSRMNKKVKEVEISKRAIQLEKDNKVLKMKVEELEKLVTSMRMALLQSALKRER